MTLFPSVRRRTLALALATASLVGCGGSGGANGAVQPDTSVPNVTVTDTGIPATASTDSASTVAASTDTGSALTALTDSTGSTAAPGSTSGGSGTTAPATTVPAATTVKPGATSVPPATTAKPPSATVAPTAPPTAPPTTKPATKPGTVTKSCAADGAVTSVKVPAGATLILTVTSVTEQEFHVHGYDLLGAGTKYTFVLTADPKFDGAIVESHTTQKPICTIDVT